MFKFLKDKLKGAISKISEGVEKEGRVEETIVEKTIEVLKPSLAPPSVEKKEEKGFFAKLKEKFSGKEEPVAEKKEKDEPESRIEKPIPETNKRIIREKEAEKPIIKEIPEKGKEIVSEYKKEVPEKIRHFEKQKEKIAPGIHEQKHVEEKKPEIKKSVAIEKPKIHKADEIKKEIPKVDIKKSHIIEKEPEAKEAPKRHIEKLEEPKEEKKGFFQAIKEKIITTKINEEQFQNLFWDLELALMENNVAMEVIEKIKNDLKEELVEKPIRRNKVEETIELALKHSIEELFISPEFNLVSEIKSKREKPYVIAFFGINGSGKTTSIAKLAHLLTEKKVSCILAASDTFRAASIEQLQLHADRLGVKMIRHDYGSDPAAVAFDAIKHAKSKGIDAVLIDTAGRMHSNQNLVDEMKKIVRVAKPDLKIFVGESITGNDCVEQAKTFNEAVGIDGIILAKADVDEKGGAAVSVSYVTKKPILYLGMGQNYGDLQKFDSEVIMKNLGFA